MELIKKPTCTTCKFFDRNETSKDAGSCREQSPQLTVVLLKAPNPMTGRVAEVPTPLAAWPDVKEDMWCGRYEAKWAKNLNS